MVKTKLGIGKNMSIREDKWGGFGSCTMHGQKIHTALIGSLIIYKCVIKHS